MKKTVKSIIISILVLIAMLFVFIFVVDPLKAQEFSADIWKDEPGKRFEMVTDLLEKYELIGMNKEEVISLLGEPADIHPSYRCVEVIDQTQNVERREFNLYTENYLFYILTDNVIPDYVKSLYIELDENDIVINVFMVSLET